VSLEEVRADKDVVDLDRYVGDAVSLAEELIASVRLSDDDHLGFIVLSFLCRLREQALSVRLLVSKAQGRDAELVARSMLETMVSLVWIGQSPQERGLQWRGYAYVEDWRLAREQRQDVPSAPEEVKRFLQKNGGRYEDPGRRGKDDPYYRDWRCGTTVKQMFCAAKGEKLYSELYGPFSDWIHAGPKSIGLAIERDGKHIRWNPAPASTRATALAAAFQCLVEALQIAGEHLKLSISGDVENLIARFVRRFSGGREAVPTDLAS
jgi:hypothetical protein